MTAKSDQPTEPLKQASLDNARAGHRTENEIANSADHQSDDKPGAEDAEMGRRGQGDYVHSRVHPPGFDQRDDERTVVAANQPDAVMPKRSQEKP